MKKNKNESYLEIIKSLILLKKIIKSNSKKK